MPHRTPLNERSSCCRSRDLHNQQPQESNIHTLSGVRSRDTSSQAAGDLRLPTGQENIPNIIRSSEECQCKIDKYVN